MVWALLLNPGKLNGLVALLLQVLTEQAATRHDPFTPMSGVKHSLGGWRRSCPASAFLLGPSAPPLSSLDKLGLQAHL